MNERIAAAALGIALCVVVAGGALAQGLSLAPELREGERMVYDLRTEVLTEQPGGEARYEQSARVELVVRTVMPSGQAVVSMRVGRVETLVRDGQSVTATLTEDGLILVEPSETPEGIAEVARELIRAEARLVVEASGVVSRVNGLDRVLERAAREGEDAVALVGMFFPEQIAATLSPVFGADRGDADVRAAGDAWETSASRPLGEGRLMRVASDWRIADEDEGVATLRAQVRVELEAAPGRGGAPVSAVIAEQSGEAEAQWDTRSAALVRRALRLDMQMIWSVGELELHQRHASTLTAARVEGAPALPEVLDAGRGALDVWEGPRLDPTAR